MIIILIIVSIFITLASIKFLLSINFVGAVLVPVIFGVFISLVKSKFKLDLPEIKNNKENEKKEIYVGSLITYTSFLLFLGIIKNFYNEKTIEIGMKFISMFL